MKLLRIGPAGQEKPAILDIKGNARDLPAHTADLSEETLTPEGLSKIAALDLSSLPLLKTGRVGVDVIATGTPPGVGMGQKPPVYLRGGETLHLGIEGLGEQAQVVCIP
jgi:hypothetical protein